MYIFHRTSEEKIQSEAPLLACALELYLHSPEEEVEKKEISHKQKTARHYFLLIVLGWGLGGVGEGLGRGAGLHSLYTCWLRRFGRSQQCQRPGQPGTARLAARRRWARRQHPRCL